MLPVSEATGHLFDHFEAIIYLSHKLFMLMAPHLIHSTSDLVHHMKTVKKNLAFYFCYFPAITEPKKCFLQEILE